MDYIVCIGAALAKMNPYASDDLIEVKTCLQRLACYLSENERRALLEIIRLSEIPVPQNLTLEKALEALDLTLRNLCKKESDQAPLYPSIFFDGVFEIQIALASKFPNNEKDNQGQFLDPISYDSLTPDAFPLTSEIRQLYSINSLNNYFSRGNAYKANNLGLNSIPVNLFHAPLTHREVNFLRSKGVSINPPEATDLLIMNFAGLGNEPINAILNPHDLSISQRLRRYLTEINRTPVADLIPARLNRLLKSMVLGMLTSSCYFLFLDCFTGFNIINIVGLGLPAAGFAINSLRNNVKDGCVSFLKIFAGMVAADRLGLMFMLNILKPVLATLIAKAVISVSAANAVWYGVAYSADVVIPLMLFAKGAYNSYRNQPRSIDNMFLIPTNALINLPGTLIKTIALVVKKTYHYGQSMVAGLKTACSSIKSFFQPGPSSAPKPEARAENSSTVNIAQRMGGQLIVQENVPQVIPVRQDFDMDKPGQQRIAVPEVNIRLRTGR